jgi:DNA-directed RNA polymerase subunit M/transcription elongation factor TFIIS
MEFCPNCKRHMPRATSASDASVVFECEICHYHKKGLAEDTLWFEKTNVHEDEKFQTILDRASRDPAGQTVAIACEECGLQYMTLVRFGKAATTQYVCECGARLDFERKKIV